MKRFTRRLAVLSAAVALYVLPASGETIFSGRFLLSDLTWTMENTYGYMSVTHSLDTASLAGWDTGGKLLQYAGILFTARADYLFTLSALMNLGFTSVPLGMYSNTAPLFMHRLYGYEYEVHLAHRFRPSFTLKIQPFTGYSFVNFSNISSTEKTEPDYTTVSKTLLLGTEYLFEPYRWMTVDGYIAVSPYLISSIYSSDLYSISYNQSIFLNTRYSGIRVSVGGHYTFHNGSFSNGMFIQEAGISILANQ